MKYEIDVHDGEILEEANSLFEQGEKAFEEKDYEEAITYFEQSKEKFSPFLPEKVEECDEWIEKSQSKLEGLCLGSILLVLMVGAGFVRWWSLR